MVSGLLSIESRPVESPIIPPTPCPSPSAPEIVSLCKTSIRNLRGNDRSRPQSLPYCQCDPNFGFDGRKGVNVLLLSCDLCVDTYMLQEHTRRASTAEQLPHPYNNGPQIENNTQFRERDQQGFALLPVQCNNVPSSSNDGCAWWKDTIAFETTTCATNLPSTFSNTSIIGGMTDDTRAVGISSDTVR
jgi:hypothetical protein